MLEDLDASSQQNAEFGQKIIHSSMAAQFENVHASQAEFTRLWY